MSLTLKLFVWGRTMLKINFSRYGVLTLMFGLTLGSSNALAQSTEASKPEDGKVAKKIVVTGSYIRRAADEGAPSPVTTVDNTKAQEAASFSAGGMLNDNAVTSASSSNVSFHGQSSANNLVLLNGLRLPKPGGGDTSDFSFIPASAIERVEILKDGASALYGSEALAGVVNIITKKEYDGANISFRHTQPEKAGLTDEFGSESNVIATYGKGFKNGNILAVFQYRIQKPTNYTDTEYGIVDVARRGSQVSDPANLQSIANPNQYFHSSQCPANLVDSRGACRYDYYDTLQFGGKSENYNALISSGFDVGDGLRFESGLVYTHRKDDDLNTPAIIRFEDLSAGGGDDYSIPGSAANNWSGSIDGNPAFAPGDKFNLLYSPDTDLGRRREIGTLDAGMAQMSLGKQTDNLDWDLSIGYGVSNYKNEMVEGNARKDLVYQKILNNQWNPFAAPGAKGDISDTALKTWYTNFADVLNTRALISGKELDLGPQSIYAAVGIEHQLQGYKFKNDDFTLQNLSLTGSGTNQSGSRNVVSTFIELTQNPIPDLQVQLAGRFDAYSDFGTTINPKLAAAYKVNPVMTVRGSYGTGFKAPDLRSLFQGDLSRPQRIRDDVICKQNGNNDPNCNNLFATTNSGNANLDPELGKHFNFGIQLRPKKNWQINIDHWRAQGEEALTDIGGGLLSRLTQVERQLGAGALTDLGVTIQRDPATNVIQFIRYPLKTNSGRYKVNGIDFEIKYRNQVNPFGLGVMNLTFRFDHSHTLKKDSQPFFFLPMERSLDINWKNVSSISLSRGNHLASWRVRTFSAGDKDTTRANTAGGYGSIPTYGEHDLHYEYYGAWNGVITAGVRNVFDKVYYNELNRGQDGFLLPASTTFLGRTFYVGYSQDF
jgi:iron complex outermembrane recepter protein